MDEWPIEFGRGVGPLRLGMTPEQAASSDPRFGAPNDVDVQPDGTTKEFRDLNWPILTFAAGKLAEIQVDEHVSNVTILGRPLFGVPTRELMRELQTMSTTVVYGFETVVFADLGLTFADFAFRQPDGSFRFHEDGADEGLTRVLTVAAAGAWDALLSEYEPVSGF